MNKYRALIWGVTGQDGYYLSKLLLEKDYEVYGVIRRHSNSQTEFGSVSNLPNINFEYGDVTDASSVEAIIHRVKPHEVYNLAAQSHVRISFDIPSYTSNTNAMGPLNIMESLRLISPYSRFYQASTSEMFGNSIDSDGFQRETTPMHPVSPYGVAKLFAHNMVGVYRTSYGLFGCSGILFNHESPKRGDNFVTKKITNYVRRFQTERSVTDKLELGNIKAQRDWGHAEDYVYGMWLMLQHPNPDDYVLATGMTSSIEQFLFKAFSNNPSYPLDYKHYVRTNPKFYRPEDVHVLKGDSTKARTILNWNPKHDLDSLIKDMINAK